MSDVAERSPILVFLHIPKTAGTTLRGIVLRQFSDEETLSVYRPGSDWPYIDSEAPPQVAGPSRIRVIYGHLPFMGARVYGRPARYITFLRDPVERLISQYYHVLQKPRGAELLRQRVTPSGMSLRDFVDSPHTAHLANGQTAAVAGASVDDPNRNSAEVLDRAIDNMRRHFILVGLTERFYESLLMLKNLLHWRLAYFRRINVRVSDPAAWRLDLETRRAIEQRESLDVELYRYAQERLEFEIERRGRSFQREVGRLRLINESFQRFPRPLQKLGARLARRMPQAEP